MAIPLGAGSVGRTYYADEWEIFRENGRVELRRKEGVTIRSGGALGAQRQPSDLRARRTARGAATRTGPRD